MNYLMAHIVVALRKVIFDFFFYKIFDRFTDASTICMERVASWAMESSSSILAS